MEPDPVRPVPPASQPGPKPFQALARAAQSSQNGLDRAAGWKNMALKFKSKFKFHAFNELAWFFLAIPTVVGWLGLSCFFKPVEFRKTAELDCLIVAYDMGDLNGLAPVAERMDAKGYRIRLMGLGQAHKSLHGQNPPAYLADLAPGDALAREQRLAGLQVKEITAAYQPRIILTGMACAAQAQLINAFDRNALPIAFYDNVEDPRGKSYLRPFMEEIRLKAPFTFFLPSERTERLFRSYLDDLRAPPGIRLAVTGNPALAAWDRAFAGTDPHLLRAALAIPAGRKVLVFAGGYEPDYADSFRIFIQGIKGRPDLQALVVPHPKTDGLIEEAIIRSEAAGNVQLLKPADLSPRQAALCTMPALAMLADLVVCSQSSVGLQARYLGKPVLYVADPRSYRNFLIEDGLAAIAHTPGEVAKVVAMTLAADTRSLPSLAAAGIPPDPIGRMVADLEAMLKHGEPSRVAASGLAPGSGFVVQSAP
jgi:hypothetical protein